MTNTEIIVEEAIAHQIYTVEEVEMMLANLVDLGLHTYAEWKRMGYQVKKGERAIIKTRLWKFHEKKVTDDEDREHYYMTNAYIFSKNQVEKIALN